MLKRIVAAALAAVLALALAGCSFRVQVNRGGEAVQPVQPAPAATPTPQPVHGGDPYGSVGLLTEPTVLVSVYLSDASGSTWSELGMAECRSNLEMAVKWIEQECARYGVKTNLIYESEEHPELQLLVDYDGSFEPSAESYETDDFYDSADDFCARMDNEDFRAVYGNVRVGYLYFLPTTGVDHTMVHYAEDGDDYYYEYSCLYRFDGYGEIPLTHNAPASYAHEILHLFGAADLYETHLSLGVDDALMNYVEKISPEDIEFDVYRPDGSLSYEDIPKEIGPVTAWFLGLASGFEGMERFPLLGNVIPGVFRESLPPEGEPEQAESTLYPLPTGLAV